MLKISQLSKNFGDTKILDEVTLSIAAGEVGIIVGASGSGKSTLLRILNNLESIDKGTVFLDDQLLDMSSVNRNHLIGIVFQQFNLFENMTVLENITFPLIKAAKVEPTRAREIALNLLQHYNLESLYNVYSHQLSGGQKQRVALARTLALKPRVICLDEPTSALDPFLKDFVAQNIIDLTHQGYIVLVATHDLALIEKLPGKLFFLNQGKIMETTAQQNFFAKPEEFPMLQSFMRKK